MASHACQIILADGSSYSVRGRVEDVAAEVNERFAGLSSLGPMLRLELTDGRSIEVNTRLVVAVVEGLGASNG